MLYETVVSMNFYIVTINRSSLEGLNMENIRKREGKLIATYQGIDYIFNNIIELITAISTLRNVQNSQLEVVAN